MRHVKQLIMIFLMIPIIALNAYGGDLEPPAGAPGSTMHTLENIYDLVNSRCNGAGIFKTGQTAPYATGDDGDLQKGVAIPSPRFTDNSDGTVTDNLTGLIWLKNANAAGAERDWTTALSDIVQLNTDGTMNGNNCGDISNGGSHQSDWRLPNRFELESLINLAYLYPCISNTVGTGKCTSNDPFTNISTGYCWSGTTYVSTAASYAWAVSLGHGQVAFASKIAPNCVWPVRGGND